MTSEDASAIPAFHQRYLPRLTRTQLAAIPDKSAALVLVPAGSIEQHGPHLPVGTDSMLAHAGLASALGKLPSSSPVYVAPPLVYGKSNEHAEYPGTLSISAKTLRRQLLALASQLKEFGFRNLAMLNAHGGNSSVVIYTLREIQTQLDMNACMLRFRTPDLPLSSREATFGIHAGEIETAWMLHLTPHLVFPDKAPTEYPENTAKPESVGPIGSAVTSTWKTGDLSKSGVMGDAAAATPEKGREWFERASDALAAELRALLAAIRET